MPAGDSFDYLNEPEDAMREFTIRQVQVNTAGQNAEAAKSGYYDDMGYLLNLLSALRMGKTGIDPAKEQLIRARHAATLAADFQIEGWAPFKNMQFLLEQIGKLRQG